LAHSKSALKRWRQNEAHRERNKPVRTGARSAVRKARELIATPGATEEAAAAIREASRVLDRAAKRNIIHRNAASRQKARLMRHLNQAGVAPATAEAPKRARKAAPATKKAAAKKAPAKKTTRKSAKE
jgi:small subunit ribosomal protein S20